MNSRSLTSSSLLAIKPNLLQLSFVSPFLDFRVLGLKKKPIQLQRRTRNLKCRAEFSQDAPFALAIGACVLNSLVFPITDGPDDDSGSAIDSTDARFAVMGIISFIPYFNWLTWVFAWMDTNRRRYVVYSIVYLAPYIRTNLSLKPEDSWLPIASIIFCIIHVQLEASIKNGDFKSFHLFNEALKDLPSITKKNSSEFEDRQEIPKKAQKKKRMDLPSAQEESRNEIQEWGTNREPLDNLEPLSEDSDGDEIRKS